MKKGTISLKGGGSKRSLEYTPWRGVHIHRTCYASGYTSQPTAARYLRLAEGLELDVAFLATLEGIPFYHDYDFILKFPDPHSEPQCSTYISVYNDKLDQLIKRFSLYDYRLWVNN